MTAQTCTEQNIKDLLERLVRGVLAETRATPAAGTAPGLAPMNAPGGNLDINAITELIVAELKKAL